MPAASLGEENFQPDIRNVEYIRAPMRTTDRLTDEEKRYIGKGMIGTILPYTILDNYDRERKPTDFPAAVLENDLLRAVFLPSLGGRLWSLYDKRLGRELLYVNPVFQPANLAIRNAWFSGGVEFNVSIKGHNPLTCDPLFTEFAETPEGEPILRMFEYERIRNIVYCIEAYIPADSGVLYLRNTIENTSREDKYTYWWSNIAVPETEGTRVVVPADDAFLCYYDEGSYLLDKTEVPVSGGVDYSYPVNSVRSQDFFYKIPKDRAKWIAAVESDGCGLIHFSQHRLFGRKVFLWGQGAGGRHWGGFLAEPGDSYIEIQAGLAYTQLEHIPFAAGETLSWVEGYCAADIDPSDAFGGWERAQAAVEAQIDEKLAALGGIADIDGALADVFPTEYVSRELVFSGKGLGYVESESRKLFGGPRLSAVVDFPESSVTENESEWLRVLHGGTFREHDVSQPPRCYLVSPKWEKVVREAAFRTDSWYGWLQYGVLLYANGGIDECERAWKRSLALAENAWAYRNLAMLAKGERGDLDTAHELILKAVSLCNTDRGLIVNAAQVLTACGDYEGYLALFDTLPDRLKKDGRLLFYRAKAYLRTGRPREAADIITPDFVMCDIKEGEVSISALWFEIYAALGEDRPLPFEIDFRMH